MTHRIVLATCIVTFAGQPAAAQAWEQFMATPRTSFNVRSARGRTGVGLDVGF